MHIEFRHGTMRLNECRFTEDGRLIIHSQRHCTIDTVTVWKEPLAIVITLEGEGDFVFEGGESR
jgi:hypothetical protein